MVYCVTVLKMPYQRIQNMCAKLLLSRSIYGSSSDVLKELHFLPVQARVDHKILSFMHQSTYGTAPTYLKEILNKPEMNRKLCSTSSNLNYVVLYNKNKTFGYRSFIFYGPLVWNKLPVTTKGIPNYKTFKKKCKTHLFTKCFKH